MPRLTLDWPHTVFLSIASIVIGALVYTCKLPASSLVAIITYLIPSPLTQKVLQ